MSESIYFCTWKAFIQRITILPHNHAYTIDKIILSLLIFKDTYGGVIRALTMLTSKVIDCKLSEF